MFKISKKLTEAESTLILCKALLKLADFNNKAVLYDSLVKEILSNNLDLIATKFDIEIILDNLVDCGYIKIERYRDTIDVSKVIKRIIKIVNLGEFVGICKNSYKTSQKLNLSDKL